MQRHAFNSDHDADQIIHTIYDALGKPIFKLPEQGRIKEYRYYANGLLKERIKYQCSLELKEDVALTAQWVAQQIRPSLQDEHEFHIYNESGYETFRINELGYVTEFIYNDNKLWVQNVYYLLPLDIQQLPEYTPAAVRKLLGDSEKKVSSVNPKEYRGIVPPIPIAPKEAFVDYLSQEDAKDETTTRGYQPSIKSLLKHSFISQPRDNMPEDTKPQTEFSSVRGLKR